MHKQSREYITKNPVRSSIGAIGYGTVSAINTVVNTIDLINDVTIIAKESLASAIIEAKEERMVLEIESFDRISELEAKLASKRESMAKA